MLSDNCLVEILGVKANVEGAIWFLGVCEEGYQFSWSGY